MTEHITAVVTQDTPQVVTIEIKSPGSDGGLDTVGYLEVVSTPHGIRVQGWNGDETDADDQMLLRRGSSS